MGDIVPLDRAERRRLARAEAKASAATGRDHAAHEPPSAPTGPEERLNLQDVQTVLLGAACWTAGREPPPPSEARQQLRDACDRVAKFLDISWDWPPDPPAPALVKPSGLILPPC